MDLKLDILPAGQRQLWPELSATPDCFALYGGTALALRLGHRQSVDFDFFSASTFRADELYQKITYLQDADVLQLEQNTLTCSVTRYATPVKISFFGGLSIVKQAIQPVDRLSSPAIKIASFPDLVATKLLVVQQRAEKKDYLDVNEILKSIPLSQAIAYARQLYGKAFNPISTLKALVYFEDGDLQTLPADVKNRLVQAVQQENIVSYG